jgi:PAS domain S-box-containing protein
MQTINILAVEDNPGDFILLEEMLSDVKIFKKSITNATSLAESLNYLKEEIFDIILLDLSLPDSTGVETFSSIYSRYPEIPTIILSGLPESEVAIESVKVGAQDYLVKGEVNTRLIEKSITYSIARKKAENDIIFKRAILSSVREAIIVTDFNGSIIYWNEGAKVKLGYDAEEIIGKPISIIYQNPITDDELAVLLKQIKEGHEFKGEFLAKAKNGSSVWLEVVTRAIKDVFGKPIGLVGVSRNIEERKKAEVLLKKSELNLKAIFNNTFQSFILIDKDYKIVSFNKMANKICYALLKRSLCEGTSFLELISSFPVDRFIERFTDTVAGNKLRLENKLPSPDGKDFWLETYFTPVKDNEGEIIGVAISTVDITQRKKDEMVIKEQNDELHKTNAELDSFVYSASHDLKAPLSAILGIVNVAMVDPVESSKEMYLRMIEKNVKRLMNTIKDLTNFSRNARAVVTKEKIDFKYLIEEILNSYQYLENARFIHWNVCIDVKNDFFSDRLRLQILFNNLISNAIIFHNIEQEKPFIFISVKSIEGGIEIAVEDNGSGIDEKYTKKIFDMFYRASTNSEGSGLGLYIVKSIVEKLKVTIQLNSKVMEGTKFILRFNAD